MEDKRLVFDTISDQFEQWREKYTPELFDYIINTCNLDETKSCLEIGPGTGQASDFAIKTGCDYTAIELGSNLASVMSSKYGNYSNFKIIIDDFETHEFDKSSFDVVYSAATIQWINEEIAYTKCYDILKNNGYFLMFRMIDDNKSANPALYDDIQKVYDEHFVVKIPYTCKFDYLNGEAYGFTYIGREVFLGGRSYDADSYAEYIQTHADHITLLDEHREAFLNGIRDVVKRNGNVITITSKYVLDIYQKRD